MLTSPFSGYRRTVLALYLKENEIKLQLKAGGKDFAIAHLQKATVVSEPSQDLKECLTYLIDNTFRAYYSDLPAILDLAIKWNNLPLWENAASPAGFKSKPLEFDWKKVIAAWEKFGFESLRPS